MHSLKITHTDLKPENILVCSTELVKTKVNLRPNKQVRPNNYSNHEHSDSEDHAKTYINPHIKVYTYLSLMISKSSTWVEPRSPMIIIVLSSTLDSIGLQRLYQDALNGINLLMFGALHVSSSSYVQVYLLFMIGELFFSTRKSDYEHLAMIEKACGPIPYWMVCRTSPPHDKHFNLNEKHFQKYNSYYQWPHTTATTENIQRIHKMKNIQESVS